MSILVTGGPGFIGANFILDWLRSSDESVINLGLKVACPEEIAFRNRWIDADQLESLAQPLLKSGYGRYLLQVLKEPVVAGSR